MNQMDTTDYQAMKQLLIDEGREPREINDDTIRQRAARFVLDNMAARRFGRGN